MTLPPDSGRLPDAGRAVAGRTAAARRAAAAVLALLVTATTAGAALAQATQGPAPSLIPESTTPRPAPGGAAPAPAPESATPSPAPARAPSEAPESAAPSQAPEVGAPTQAPEGATATAGPRDGQEFQEWALHCQVPAAGAPEVCEMHQRIVEQNRNRVLLLAAVGRLPNDTPGLLIVLPLGIALPPGVQFKIDAGEPQRAEVKQCEQRGCMIELLLEPGLLARLKAGAQATVSFYIFDHQRQPTQVDLPISLLGFSAALAEVMR